MLSNGQRSQYCLKAEPASHPKTGINAWKNANENDIFIACVNLISFSMNPLEVATANESNDNPMQLKISLKAALI